MKYKYAQIWNIPVVTLDWAFECVNQHQYLPAASFSLDTAMEDDERFWIDGGVDGSANGGMINVRRAGSNAVTVSSALSRARKRALETVRALDPPAPPPLRRSDVGVGADYAYAFGAPFAGSGVAAPPGVNTVPHSATRDAQSLRFALPTVGSSLVERTPGHKRGRDGDIVDNNKITNIMSNSNNNDNNNISNISNGVGNEDAERDSTVVVYATPAAALFLSDEQISAAVQLLNNCDALFARIVSARDKGGVCELLERAKAEANDALVAACESYILSHFDLVSGSLAWRTLTAGMCAPHFGCFICCWIRVFFLCCSLILRRLRD